MTIITTEEIEKRGGRWKIRERLDEFHPEKILAPFGGVFPIKPETKILMQEKKWVTNYHKNLLDDWKEQIKFSKNLHAKAMINSEEAIIGSCNWTENSLDNEHEIIKETTDKTDVETLNKFFDKLWGRAH